MSEEQYSTRVLGINLPDEVYAFLEGEGMFVYQGDYGPIIDARGKFGMESYLPISCRINIPKNLQEYEVIIEDMHHIQKDEYMPQNNKTNTVLSDDSYDNILSLCIHSPQNEFNPVPLGCATIEEKLANKKQPLIKVAFQEIYYEAHYTGLTARRYIQPLSTYNNYQYLNNFCNNPIAGDKVCLTDYQLSYDLYEGLTSDIYYVETYKHPETPDYKPSKDFIPLLTNKQGDIISYIFFNTRNGDVTIMLPQLKDKPKLLKRLFNNFLYKYESQFFPMQTATSWLSNPEYELPEVMKLEQDKREIEAKAKAEIQKKDAEIKACHENLAFLFGLLTDTGDDLVDDVVTYLKWLGFDDATKADDDVEDGGLLQEDIQVHFNENDILIIEVKGVHGTSTDNECAQIGKNILRRVHEHIYKNVYGLYIVNNEMGKEPLKRTLPPFNDMQIKDAENSYRGLAYTYQLFNLYFEIEDGIVTKEEARQSMLDYGLVNFRKKFRSIGKPYKYIKDNKVICIDLHETEIKVGTTLYYEDNRKRLQKCTVVRIEQERVAIKVASNGKTGIGLDKAIPKVTEMLVRKQ